MLAEGVHDFSRSIDTFALISNAIPPAVSHNFVSVLNTIVARHGFAVVLADRSTHLQLAPSKRTSGWVSGRNCSRTCSRR